VVRDQRFELVGECPKAARKRRGCVSLDLAIGDMREAVAVGFDQPPAGGAEARVEAENLQVRRSNSSSGTS
jgi:hypothetical protein